jgi:hypothetical protein
MWSLKSEIKNNVQRSKVSLIRDIFGYSVGQLPKRPNGGPISVSLKAWAALGRFNSFNVMTIFVGIESFANQMFAEIDTAIHRMREIYSAIGIGVKWVVPWGITTADADGLDVLTSEDEVDDLLAGWGFDKNAINLFFPA